MRWKWGLLGMIGATALIGCLDIGGKLDTPIEGGNGGSLGGLGALGDGGAATGTFSCDHHAVDSTCTTYAAGTTQEYAQAYCDGTLLQTRCPTMGAVGSCQVGGETDVYYSDGALPRTASDAKAACDFSGGVFSN